MADKEHVTTLRTLRVCKQQIWSYSLYIKSSTSSLTCLTYSSNLQPSMVAYAVLKCRTDYVRFIFSHNIEPRCCQCRQGDTMYLNWGHQRAYCSSPRWYLSIESHAWNYTDRENRRIRRKTYPSATLSITNATWTEPGENPGLHSERSATNCLSHGTANIEPHNYKFHKLKISPNVKG
jgi:hypothetical protein